MIIKGAMAILALAIVVAVSISRPDEPVLEDMFKLHVTEDISVPKLGRLKSGSVQSVSDKYRYLTQTEGTPEGVAEWLRLVAQVKRHTAAGWSFDAEALTIREFDINQILDRHVGLERQRLLFADYARYLLLADSESKKAAQARLHAAALEPSPLRYAREFDGDQLMKDGKRKEALEKYEAEGNVADAKRPRKLAWALAIELRNADALRLMVNDPRYRIEANSRSLFEVGLITGDLPLALHYFVINELNEWLHPEAFLAIFAVSIWFFMMVHATSTVKRRWSSHIPAVLAGIVSTWLIDWGHLALKLSDGEFDSLPPEEALLHYIMNVGLPEETAKLIMFIPFLVILLRKRNRSEAALCAGCVGLGFALAENINYYVQAGASVAPPRMITANFFHMALTGILGVRVYDWLRGRGHNTPVLLAAFGGVVAAHGLYDFLCSQGPNLPRAGFANLFVLAVAARLYFAEWRNSHWVSSRSWASSSAVFVLGCVLLESVVLITVGSSGTHRDVYDTLLQTVSLVPVVWIFMHEFQEA